MLFFDIACIFIRKLNDSRMKKIEKRMMILVNKEKGTKVSLNHQKKLIKKLKKVNYFIAFRNILERMNEKERVVYLKNLKYTIIKIVPYYHKKEIIKETYFVHFLKEYAYIYSDNDNAIIHYLISAITANSVYLRENALNALYQVGKVSYLLEAFEKMNYLQIHHHHKLITDGLLKFQGNMEELTESLIQNIKEYSEEYQVAFINFFSYQKISCEEKLYTILKNKNTSKEVRIACIRYFSNVIYEPVTELLYELLHQSKLDWEYAAIAASTLSHYKSEKTTDELTSALTSHNWYVRNNAAISLTKTNSDSKLYQILKKLEDKYALDALTYQIRMQRKEG